MMQDEISNLVRPLRAAIAGRFTPRENRHITLAFLGDTPASSLPDIEAALESAAANAGEIVLKPDRLGKFGRCDDATLWLGLANDSGLMNLASDLHEELRAHSIPFDDKPFLPHVTIARRARIPEGNLPPLPFPSPAYATRITLFKSTLSSGGASYEEIRGIGLHQVQRRPQETARRPASPR